jgi:hypothetical protein
MGHDAERRLARQAWKDAVPLPTKRGL